VRKKEREKFVTKKIGKKNTRRKEGLTSSKRGILTGAAGKLGYVRKSNLKIRDMPKKESRFQHQRGRKRNSRRGGDKIGFRKDHPINGLTLVGFEGAVLNGSAKNQARGSEKSLHREFSAHWGGWRKEKNKSFTY